MKFFTVLDENGKFKDMNLKAPWGLKYSSESQFTDVLTDLQVRNCGTESILTPMLHTDTHTHSNFSNVLQIDTHSSFSEVPFKSVSSNYMTVHPSIC